MTDALSPGTSQSPPLNVLTDTAALLARAELRGVDVPAKYWKRISAYAAERFPKPAIAFADVHAALAHAMAGDSDALKRIVAEAAGPAADLVQGFAQGFDAFARADWAGACQCFGRVLVGHERLGGSRAQRDLLEMAMAASLLRIGRGDEARRFLVTRRPATMGPEAVAGLAD